MARRRVAVALLVPPPVAHDLDVLRRALGEADTSRVRPHLTLVPPTNVAEDRLGLALAVLRAAAAPAGGPLTLRLGPLTSFSPVTPTLHLAVRGNGEAIESLTALHASLIRPPLGRPPEHPFVPHVTLLEQAPLHRIRAACMALDHVDAVVEFARITMLAEQRQADGVRRWRPLADVDLGGVHMVGRGGLPIELARGSLLDPEARNALGLTDTITPADEDQTEMMPAPGRAAGPRIVVARMAEEVVGAAWGPGPGQRRVVGPVDGDLLTAAWHQAG